jgi:hypothetical protein
VLGLFQVSGRDRFRCDSVMSSVPGLATFV